MLNKHNETTIIYDFGDPIKCEIFIKASDIPKAIYYSILFYNNNIKIGYSQQITL
jgi:hypothetical protein